MRQSTRWLAGARSRWDRLRLDAGGSVPTSSFNVAPSCMVLLGYSADIPHNMEETDVEHKASVSKRLVAAYPLGCADVYTILSSPRSWRSR